MILCGVSGIITTNGMAFSFVIWEVCWGGRDGLGLKPGRWVGGVDDVEPLA